MQEDLCKIFLYSNSFCCHLSYREGGNKSGPVYNLLALEQKESNQQEINPEDIPNLQSIYKSFKKFLIENFRKT